jgi:hypothetical protein
VIVVGNRFTLHTYAPEHRRKMVLVNYAADTRLLPAAEGLPPPGSLLRRHALRPAQRIHGRAADLGRPRCRRTVAARDRRDARPPWDSLLAGCRGHVTYHGFVNSKERVRRVWEIRCEYCWSPEL